MINYHPPRWLLSALLQVRAAAAAAKFLFHEESKVGGWVRQPANHLASAL
jgi:hypothetical protein